MGEMPLYEREAMSSFQQQLVRMGFVSWYRISSSTPSAFYTLMGTGILYHLSLHYDISEHLLKHYAAVLPTLLALHLDTQILDKWNNLEFWTKIGPALISDFDRKFQSKPAAPTVRAGKMPDKSTSNVFEALMATCLGMLVWYECVEGNILCHVWSEKGRNPAIYLCGAEEGGCYYLLIHQSFQQSAEREGFPYFTTSPASRENIPMPLMEQTVATAQPTYPQESFNQPGILDFIRAINEQMTRIEQKCDTLTSRVDSLEKTVVEKLEGLTNRLSIPRYS